MPLAVGRCARGPRQSYPLDAKSATLNPTVFNPTVDRSKEITPSRDQMDILACDSSGS